MSNSNNLPGLKAWSDYIGEFRTESDRGAVLVAAAFIDDTLRCLIQATFLDKPATVRRLLGGPCSTFSARTDLALCLGLIGTEMHEDIRRISKMRNRFAHEPQGLNFDDPATVDSCSQFHLIVALKQTTKTQISAKVEFMITAGAIINKLRVALRSAKHIPAGPTYNEMPIDVQNPMGY
jgi:DNA-binding MltR family transcriptional regulator